MYVFVLWVCKSARIFVIVCLSFGVYGSYLGFEYMCLWEIYGNSMGGARDHKSTNLAPSRQGWQASLLPNQFVRAQRFHVHLLVGFCLVMIYDGCRGRFLSGYKLGWCVCASLGQSARKKDINLSLKMTPLH